MANKFDPDTYRSNYTTSRGNSNGSNRYNSKPATTDFEDFDDDSDFEELDLDEVAEEEKRRVDSRPKTTAKAGKTSKTAKTSKPVTNSYDDGIDDMPAYDIDDEPRTNRSSSQNQNNRQNQSNRRNSANSTNSRGNHNSSNSRSNNGSRNGGNGRKNRNSRRRRRQQKLRLLAVILGLVVLLIIIALVITQCGKGSSGTGTALSTDETTNSIAATETSTKKGLPFPYDLGNGLVVNTLFVSDIDNPDADNEYADDIISIEVQNNSSQTLVDGDFEATLEDGTVVPFHIDYLPVGEKIWAFATNNATAENPICESISMTTDDMTGDDLQQTGTFTTSVSGTTITITNTGSEDKSNVTVYCHCKFDDVLYGGLVYAYSAGNLSSGESTTVDASDCWLGDAEVVAVTTD